MKFSHLRRSDVQAKYALMLSIVSLVPFLGAAALIIRNYHKDLVQIVYGAQGFFIPLFLGCLVCAVIPGTLAFVLGWSSSGHRRNDKPARSWIGFFLGGAVLTLCIIMALAFFMLRLKNPV